MDEYKIIIAHRAYVDLIERVSFLKNVSVEAAESLRVEIIDSIRSLSTFPEAYPVIENLTICGFMVRKMPIHNGRYLILYKIEEDTVTVYDVIDSRKDNSALVL